MDRRHFMMNASASLLTAGCAGFIPFVVRAAEGGMQVTAAQRFRIGDMTVTAMSDGFIPLDPAVIQGIEQDGAMEILKGAHYDPANIHGSVNTYLIETGSDTWLIDAGADGVFGPTLGGVPGVLKALGKDPEDISKVIITHMHGDHIGGTLAVGGPLYTNAELIVTEADVNFWTSDEIQAKAPEAFRGAFDLAKGVIAAYGDRVTTISGEADVAPGIVARPMPGHTVGHTGYVLESNGDSLLIWGDVLVVAALQLAKPDVTTVYDTDPAQAVATRKDLLASLAGTDQMAAGMHMPFPGIGYVTSAGEGFGFTPANWEYF